MMMSIISHSKLVNFFEIFIIIFIFYVLYIVLNISLENIRFKLNTISTHLNNILESGDLVKSEVTFNPNDFNNSEIVIINPDAKTQPISYSLDT